MPKKFRLQGKLATVVLTIVVLCVLISTIISLLRLRTVVRDRLDSTGVFVSQALATFCVENLLAWDYPSLQLSLEHTAEYDPYILGIEVHHKINPGDETSLVASYKTETEEEGLEYDAPVVVMVLGEERELGNVKIFLSDKKFQAFYAQQIYSLLILALILGLGDTFLIYLTVRKLILQPLARIEKGVNIISEGNLEHQIEIKSGDEIGSLAESFNVLATRLRRMRAREELISKMKSDFISIAAHQLRTPLSAMKWALQMILKGDMGKISSDAKDHLEKTYQSNDRLINLMNVLLSVARIEEGRFLYDLKKSSIKDLLKDTVDYSNSLALEQKIKVEFDVPKIDPPKIKIDVEKLKLAFQNLFNNALKYSEPGSKIVVNLKHTTECDERNCILIEIKDTGIGISKEDQENIFTKFFRAQDAMKFNSEGTGLGLFITKNIIEAHGGKIWFTSVKNKGTTFHIKLPVDADKHCELCEI